MNTKFTKGPWTVTKYGSVVDQNKQCVRVKGLALACYQNDEVDANTSLIAAAPDLYEALNYLAQEMDADGLNAGTTYGPMIYKAMQALAKARGEL